MDEERPVSGISRRSMLKRIGAGAAIAWSAPILSSMRTPAFARHYPGVCDGPPGTGCAIGGVDCPAPTAQPLCDTNCSCLRTVDKDCFCHQSIACDDPRVATCTTDATCPPGWRCSFSCCGGPLCHPPCGAGITVATGAGTSGG